MSDLARTNVRNICYWIDGVPGRPPVKLMCWYLPLHLEYLALEQCKFCLWFLFERPELVFCRLCMPAAGVLGLSWDESLQIPVCPSEHETLSYMPLSTLGCWFGGRESFMSWNFGWHREVGLVDSVDIPFYLFHNQKSIFKPKHIWFFKKIKYSEKTLKKSESEKPSLSVVVRNRFRGQGRVSFVFVTW